MSTISTLQSLTMGHVGLNVVDLERSKAFYMDLFGFDVAAEGTDDDRRWVFLASRGQLLLTLWQQSSGQFAPGMPGLHHLSFQVETIEELRTAEARLQALDARFLYDGVVLHAEGAASGGIFFTDPDGTRLEIYVPTVDVAALAPSGEAPTCGFF